MSAMAFQITSLTTVCSTVYSRADQRKHESSAPLAFVRGIDDVIMLVVEHTACNWKEVGAGATRVALFSDSLDIDMFENISSAIEDGGCCLRLVGISCAYLYK